MFSRNTNTLITGGEFVHINDNRNKVSFAFEKLQRASAPSALHDSSARFDPPKCHPNTRIAVLEYIMGWIFGRNDPEALILWLYGPAGAGKSAILQTIAERCAMRSSLLASFFFGRSDPTRNVVEPFIPTISCQIAITLPEIRPRIESAIERDPFVFDKSIVTQLQSLIIQPLETLIASGFFDDPEAHPRLILIDGLDECTDPKMQSLLIQVLADALRSQRLPLIFLIASRPEQNISLTFNSPPLVGLWKSLVLDDTYKPTDDIRTFLVDSFQKIKSTHPHHKFIPDAWPSTSDINHLVQKSSGQFIYAAVVSEYISAPHDRPPRRLEVIIGLRSTRRDGEIPFAELDALYMHLLESCPDPESVVQVVGIVLAGLRQKDWIEALLGLQPGDVNLALGPLSSIIDTTGSQVYLLHASFGDFLVDRTRSGPFHVDTMTVKENIISTCVAKAMNPYSIIDNQDLLNLSFMGRILYPVIRSTPLTDKIRTSLMKLSLPHVWKVWAFEMDGGKQRSFGRMVFVYTVLHALRRIPAHKPLSFATKEHQMLHEFYISSFEPIFKSEFRKYYHGTELIHLAVITTITRGLRPAAHKIFQLYEPAERTEMIQHLLQLTDESIAIDDCTFELAALFPDYIYVCADFRDLLSQIPRDTYAETALRLLRFLCKYPPPRPILRQKVPHRNYKPHSFHNSRARRIRRHQRGVNISKPQAESKSGSGLIYPYDYCAIGLELLPEVLKHASASLSLVDFLRTNGRNIAFVPSMTRKAVGAMHDYLNRVHG